MASEKAMYWMAVGLVALSLGNHFVRGFDGRCLADRSLAAAQRLSGHASRIVAMTEFMLGGTSLPQWRTQTEIVRMQAHFASVDIASVRQQAACARIEAEHERRMALQQVQQMRLEVLCPRQTLRLNVQPPPAVPREGTI